jgi:hypothetical protein
MRQAVAAARLLQVTSDVHGARALETALVVCYARPFGSNDGIGPLSRETYAPVGTGELTLHKDLLWLRDKAYAHTDKASGRSIKTARLTATSSEPYAEHWIALNREALPLVIALFESQAIRFSAEAKDTADELAELPHGLK